MEFGIHLKKKKRWQGNLTPVPQRSPWVCFWFPACQWAQSQAGHRQVRTVKREHCLSPPPFFSLPLVSTINSTFCWLLDRLPCDPSKGINCIVNLRSTAGPLFLWHPTMTPNLVYSHLCSESIPFLLPSTMTAQAQTTTLSYLVYCKSLLTGLLASTQSLPSLSVHSTEQCF